MFPLIVYPDTHIGIVHMYHYQASKQIYKNVVSYHVNPYNIELWRPSWPLEGCDFFY